ncbi:MAG: zinc ribbon domain-containing protein [Anaerolineae bacterium]|nr:zinc ribbon domain-containing protein [Anaerolineae bacterium]
MNGITCRNCNTINAAGSKFCNNCGTQLPPQTTQICGNCGTSNPQNRLYCDNCGNRLGTPAKPTTPEKPSGEPVAQPPSRHGFILPSRRPGDTGELNPDDLPEWLKTGERPGAEPSPERQTRITDWLSELTELPEEQEPDRFTIDYGFLERPKWPGRERPAVEEGSTESPELNEEIFQDLVDDKVDAAPWSDELPKSKADLPPEDEWFTELPDLAPATDPAPATNRSEDWLADFSLSEPSDPQSESQADWLSQWDEPAEPDSAMAAASSDWLSDLTITEEDAAAMAWKPEGGTDVPPWLADLEPRPAAQSEERLNEAELFSLPDDGYEDEMTPFVGAGDEEPFPQMLGQTADDELPDWLAEFTDEGAAATDQPDWLPTDEADAIETIVSDWLTDDTEAETDATISDWLADEPDEEAQATVSDWLASETDEEAEATVSDWLADEAVEDSEAIVSDWLADGTNEAAEAVVSDWLSDEAEEEVGSIVSDWLSAWPDESKADETVTADEIDTAFVHEEPDKTHQADSQETFDLTGWLHELEADQGEDDAEAVAATHLVEDDMPDWLGDSSPSLGETGWDALFDESTPSSEADEVIPAEFPDWLAELRTPHTSYFTSPPDAPQPEPPPGDTGVPDWMSGVLEPADEPAAAPTRWDQVEDDYPFPSDTAAARPPVTPTTTSANEPVELARAELPDWLQQSLQEGNVVSTTGPSTLLPDLPLPQDDLPEWLAPPGDEDFDSALEAALSVRGSELVGGDLGSEWGDILGDLPTTEDALLLERGEIPEWIQEMRPRELSGQEAEADQGMEEMSGPLMGMRKVIPIEPVIAKPKINVAAAAPYTISKEHQQQAALLHQLIHAEPKAVTQVGPTVRSISFITRLSLALLLLLAVLLGLILPRFDVTVPLLLPAPLPGVTETQQTLLAVEGTTAIIAFEYTPALSGELDPQARLIIQQLQASGKQVVAVSQYAAGIGQAQSLGIPLANTQLIPGETIGLRTLAGCLNGAAACPASAALPGGVSAQDVGLIVVLTAERDSLIGWLEQVGSQTNIPLVMGTTQGLAPLAQPYLLSGQMNGLLAGLPAAAAYEQAVSGRSGPVTEQLQGQTVAQLLIVLLFIIGAAYYTLTRSQS